MWMVAGSILTKPRPQVHAGPLRLSAVLYCEKLPRCPRLAVDVDVRDQCDQAGVELSLSSCRSPGRQSGPTFRLHSNHLVPIRLWREYRVPPSDRDTASVHLDVQQLHNDESPAAPNNVQAIASNAKMLSSLGNPRQAAAQLLNFGLIISTAFMVRPRASPSRLSRSLTWW